MLWSDFRKPNQVKGMIQNHFIILKQKVGEHFGEKRVALRMGMSLMKRVYVLSLSKGEEFFKRSIA